MKQTKNKTYDFVLLGRITIDFNPLDYYNNLAQLTRFQRYVGGSTGNTAIGLSRLNNKVVLISKISSDPFGQVIVNCLEQEKMDLQGLIIDPARKTGLTFTEMLSPHESNILMYRDNVADLALIPQEVDDNLIISARYLVFSGTALAQSPSREAVLKSLLVAKQYQTKIVFDLDFRNYVWTDQLTTKIYYQLVAQQADVIIGSYEELFLCSQFLNLGDHSFATLAKHWLQTAEAVIIKDGKNGSMIYTKTKAYKIKIIPVEMLKAFGGGDAYAAYFLHHYLKNPNDLVTAGIYATAAASYMVKSHSSFDHPSYEVLQTWLNAQTNNNPHQLVEEISDWNQAGKSCT